MNPADRPSTLDNRRSVWTAAGITVAFLLLGLAYYTAQRHISTLPATLPVIQPDRYLVGAHYYIWYPSKFREGYLREHLRPKQTFPGGEYQSTDTNVIARHIAGAPNMESISCPSTGGRGSRNAPSRSSTACTRRRISPTSSSVSSTKHGRLVSTPCSEQSASTMPKRPG